MAVAPKLGSARGVNSGHDAITSGEGPVLEGRVNRLQPGISVTAITIDRFFHNFTFEYLLGSFVDNLNLGYFFGGSNLGCCRSNDGWRLSPTSPKFLHVCPHKPQRWADGSASGAARTRTAWSGT